MHKLSHAASLTPTPMSSRGVVGYKTRELGPDHPDVVEARRELAVSKIDAAVQKILDEAPPLGPTQRAKIAALLSTVVTPVSSEPDQVSA